MKVLFFLIPSLMGLFLQNANAAITFEIVKGNVDESSVKQISDIWAVVNFEDAKGKFIGNENRTFLQSPEVFSGDTLKSVFTKLSPEDPNLYFGKIVIYVQYEHKERYCTVEHTTKLPRGKKAPFYLPTYKINLSDFVEKGKCPAGSVGG